jgi:hypothetical protein
MNKHHNQRVFNASSPAGVSLSASGIAGNVAIFTSATSIGPSFSANSQSIVANGSSAWTFAGLGTQTLQSTSGIILVGASQRISLNSEIDFGTTSVGTAYLSLSTGGIIKYNNVTTVGTGVSPLYARLDLTAQSAAIGATLLYTTPNLASPSGEGQYRISWSAIVTTAATTSSVLGGTDGFQVQFTDLDTGTVITPLSVPNALATGNTVGTQLSGEVIINAKRNTAIDVSFGYTSVGATAMVFALHVKCEYLG